MSDDHHIECWRWHYTDDMGKRRKTSYHLTEADARARLRDPVPVEHSLERRQSLGHTSDFQKRP